MQNYVLPKIEPFQTEEATQKTLAFFKLYATITKTNRIVEVGASSHHILFCQEGSATSILVAEPYVISLIMADQYLKFQLDCEVQYMAVIDYGAVVIKNGEVLNKNIFFMNMLAFVGWVDHRRIRYEDCNVLTDPDPLLAESNCAFCNRAQFRRFLDPQQGEQKELIADCRGTPLPDRTGSIDHNYYAYAGDPHFTVAFHKCSAVICVDGQEKYYLWCMDDKAGKNRKSRWLSFGGVKIHLKEVSDWVYHMSFHYNGDNYHIIYGYGIDPSPSVWHRIKVRYLGKQVARKVDNLYRRFIPGGFR